MRLARVLPLAVVAALLLAVGLVVQLAPGAASRTGTAARPERFMSLALDDPLHIPTVAAPGGAVRFSFTIASTYATPRRQAWIVTVGPPDRTGTPQAAGVAMVPAGGRVSVPVGVTISWGFGVMEVRVTAPGGGMAPLQFPVRPNDRGTP